MGRKVLSIQMPQEAVDNLDEEANQLNMSRSEYIRKHLRVGRRVMKASGQLDRDFLETIVEEETDHLRGDITTSLDEIETEVLNVVPADSHRAASAEEIRKSIFGTVDEQLSQVKDVLEVLNQRDEINVTVDGEFYKDG
jgi:metal-responsive CopG/Arc/MetJ family transcriptional regulator